MFTQGTKVQHVANELEEFFFLKIALSDDYGSANTARRGVACTYHKKIEHHVADSKHSLLKIKNR